MERHEFKEHNLQKKANQEIEKTEILLQKLMPYTALTRLREGNSASDFIRDVPLLYADIAGFTEFSAKRKPKEVVKMLSRFFSDFDELCELHKVFKVYTIGDCYVVMGFRDDGNVERNTLQELINTIEFALAMADKITELNKQEDMGIGMRIGIHVGDMVTGVTGTNVVRFDTYGVDVLIANKMESEGVKGFVNISNKAKNILEQNGIKKYVLKFNKKVEIKLRTRDLTTNSYLVLHIEDAIKFPNDN